MSKTVVPRFKERRKIYLKEWRIYRGLTQEQLAGRSDMSPGNISLLERGLQNYTQDGLEHLADALNCNPGELLMVDPNRSAGIWSIWERALPTERQQIEAVAEALISKKAG